MGWTGPSRAACATSTALSRPPENNTAVTAGIGTMIDVENPVATEAPVQLPPRIMYLVTKRIEFCYGHRLLDYDGVCKHPHGHNALAEIEVRTDRLDAR